MRITAVLLLVACLQVSAKGWGQEKVTLDVKNETLENIFFKIRKQTGYDFLFDVARLKKAPPVSIKVNQAPLNEVLDYCFKDKPFKYSIVNKVIIVQDKEIAAGGINSEISIDLLPIDIKGRVVNENGAPVEGVTVSVKGTRLSTNTNANGEFSLSSVDQDAILVFTHISMETFELKISGKKELLVRLQTKIRELGGVEIVSTGYQQISKERATGSFTKVDSALFNRQPSTDLLSRLDGITNSLLFLKTSGTPAVQIRGINSINSGNGVLIILDNFPYKGDINNINPNDIEDITILKDAAAASVWGAQAGNGVIVIKTKKGKYNQNLSTTFTSNIRIQEKPDLFYYPQMSASDFIDVEEFLFEKGYYDFQLQFPFYYVVSPVITLLDRERRGVIGSNEAITQINTLRLLDVRNDYKKYVFRNAANQQYHLSINGGGRQTNYIFSMGYDKNSSQFKDDGYVNRYTINSEINFQPLKALGFNAGINFSQSDSKGSPIPYPLSVGGLGSGRSQIYPYAQLADEQGNPLSVTRGYTLAWIDTVGNANGKLLDWHYRPLDELKFNSGYTKNQTYLVKLGINTHLASWLNGIITYQYGRQLGNVHSIQDLNSYNVRNMINYYTDPNTYERYIPIGGILDIKQDELVSHNGRAQLNFQKKWEKHELTALIAGEFSEYKASSNSNRIYGYDNNKLTYSSNTNYDEEYPYYFSAFFGKIRIPNSLFLDENLNRFVSFLGNISYSYRNRYILYGSARKDGSNIFGTKTNNKWKPLWSMGLAWNVSHERFYRARWLDLLKFRVSYGYTGNSNNSIPAFATIGYLPTLSNYTGSTQASITSVPNPSLRWEETGNLNIGIDFSIFQNRFSGSFDWFKKESNDIIARFPIDPTTGESSTYFNAAQLRGSGCDINFNMRNSVGNLEWNTTINFSYVKTIVSKYYENFVKTPIVSGINPHEGQIAFGLYSYKWMGLDPTNGDPQGYLLNDVSKSYSSIFLDSFQNQIFHGSSQPLFFGNLLNSIQFNNITVSFNISYRFSYFFRRPSISYSNLFDSWVGHEEFSERWQKPGDELYTNVPSMIYPANSNRDYFYRYSEANVERGDHIRLRDFKLSYDLKNSRFPIKGMQIYVYASQLNIFLWKATKFKIDPDYTGTILINPPNRIWSVGMTLNLR